ncbi:MAG: lytic murein transglycosylase [Alteromonadaceae bacterium]|nr:lytic murein transglycosylase [Alteromonadaceae bacterium]|tara:strand:+ start:348 stop:2450 length:2103 start_codon:yes stop_codon:yes gene_type:complete
MKTFFRQHITTDSDSDPRRRSVHVRALAFTAMVLSGLAPAAAYASVPEISPSDQLVLDQLNAPAMPADVRKTEGHVRERGWFEQAEKALRNGQKAKYRDLKARLADYPLYPYLELQEVQSRFYVASPEEVQHVVDQYADVPLAEVVKTRWLYELGRRTDWAALLEAIPQPAPGNNLRCLELRAKLEVEGVEAISSDMPSLWLTGHSLPDGCDPVLEAWRKADGLSPDLLWQRAALAIKAGNSGLADYLKRYMNADLRAATDTLAKVHRDPARVAKVENFPPSLPRVTEIVAHGMVQYSRREPEQATALWPEYKNTLPFTPAQTSSVNRSLALMMAVRYLPQAPELLAEARAADADPNLYEWQARVYLRTGDWKAVKATIGGFPEDLRNESRWQYWLARAEAQLGRHDSAQARFAVAASERNFYGFMAADRLGAPYRLNHQSHPFNEEDVQAIRSMPAVSRAHEFYQMGRLREARQEWTGLLSRLEPHQVLVASHMARAWGWHEQGVRGAIVAQQWDDLQMRFPLAHQELFTNHATLRKLDVNWVYALARQESAFMPDARSPAGALGLLQLMPATARQTAQETGRPLKNNQQLLQPARNIELGTAHLAELLTRFNNNRILATAAYNAGAHRVTEWLREGGDQLEPDVWIETMPYYETRQYVQNVLAYTVIYGFRRGEPPANLLTERELACLCLVDPSLAAD